MTDVCIILPQFPEKLRKVSGFGFYGTLVDNIDNVAASVIRRLHLPFQTKFYLCDLCCLYHSLKAIFGYMV